MEKKWLMRLDGAARRGVITGSVTRVLYKRGEGAKMYSHPKEGTEVGLALSVSERACLERMGREPEFVVRVVRVDVDMERGEMWLVTSPEIDGSMSLSNESFTASWTWEAQASDGNPFSLQKS